MSENESVVIAILSLVFILSLGGVIAGRLFRPRQPREVAERIAPHFTGEVLELSNRPPEPVRSYPPMIKHIVRHRQRKEDRTWRANVDQKILELEQGLHSLLDLLAKRNDNEAQRLRRNIETDILPLLREMNEGGSE